MPIISSLRLIQMVAACGTFGAVVFKFLVWCGAVGYVSGLRGVSRWFTGRRNPPQTGHITYSSTPDQRPVNQSAKYHRQQTCV